MAAQRSTTRSWLLVMVAGSTVAASPPAIRNGTWNVPCPAGKPGACRTPDVVSTTIVFDPPLPKDNTTVAVWFSACNAGGGWKHAACPCCGDALVVQAKNITADRAVLQIRRGTGGGWGQALVVSWTAPGPPLPPPPPPPPRTTPLSVMMFYGFNETAQCGWTTHGWQELGTDQAFKKNLSVALADVVSFHAHCHAGGFVMVPPAVWTPLRHGATDWGLQLDAFESTQWLRHCFGPSPTAFPSSIPPRGCRVA